MGTRSTAALILLVDNLRRLGHDVGPVLRPFGLDPDRLDPDASIDRDLERRINEALGLAIDDPLAGLRVGAGIGIGSYGPFTLLLLTCADAAETVRTAIAFQSLSFLFGRLGFAPGPVHSEIVLEPPVLAGRAQRFRVDLEVAGIWKLMQDVNRAAQVDVRPERVVMPYPRPPEDAEYERAFGCGVQWGGRTARLRVRNEALRARFATADPGAHALVRAQCQRLAAEQQRDLPGVARRLRAYVAAHVDALPSVGSAAAALGTSERSLRRHLRAEGTGYRALLDDVRLQKAQELLRDERLPVERIAQRLGYSEPAAFIHAFRRWTGQSPAAYRRARRGH